MIFTKFEVVLLRYMMYCIMVKTSPGQSNICRIETQEEHGIFLLKVQITLNQYRVVLPPTIKSRCFPGIKPKLWD